MIPNRGGINKQTGGEEVAPATSSFPFPIPRPLPAPILPFTSLLALNYLLGWGIYPHTYPCPLEGNILAHTLHPCEGCYLGTLVPHVRGWYQNQLKVDGGLRK